MWFVHNGDSPNEMRGQNAKVCEKKCRKENIRIQEFTKGMQRQKWMETFYVTILIQGEREVFRNMYHIGR